VHLLLVQSADDGLRRPEFLGLQLDFERQGHLYVTGRCGDVEHNRLCGSRGRSARNRAA